MCQLHPLSSHVDHLGQCTFAPFRRCRSKTNCHSLMSISHYSFWNFRSKTKSGSQIPLSVLAPKSKSKSWSSLFVLELLLPIPKAESFFHYSFWNFRSQNERRSCWSWTFVLEHEWKSQVDFSLPVLEPLLQVENPKAKFHNSIIELPIRIETWIPDKKKEWRHYERNSFTD